MLNLRIPALRMATRKLSKSADDLDWRSRAVHQLLARAGIIATQDIQIGVDRGVDINGKPFKRLSDNYADSHRGGSHGGTRRGYDHILQDTGRMLASVGHRVIGDSVHIGPRSAQEAIRGIAHQLGIGVPKREWLGFRDEMVEHIENELADWWGNGVGE